jgi:hypothetical protein
MAYEEALNKIRSRRILGLLIQLTGILFTGVSLLKYISTLALRVLAL